MSEPSQATVLIVEDEPELAEEYADWLDDEYTIYTAHSGDAALERLAEAPVDVVLLDRRLPDVPGSEVLAELRERGDDCRVAMITAVDPDFDILELAIDDYVVKPVLKDDLKSIVRVLLRLAGYDDLVQESYSIASKLRAIATGEQASEVTENDEYQRLGRRLRQLRDRIDESIDAFGERELDLIYRDLDLGDGADD